MGRCEEIFEWKGRSETRQRGEGFPTTDVARSLGQVSLAIEVTAACNTIILYKGKR